ncbi:iron-sulfur cluster repair di-iron protein [Sphingobacterium hotanense]|uniref:iron-sulfur cluster repair di-iron protein n=1 Tax=Sphingobacterium hotanense TaxID=649196 RepID=UPI0021A34C79|nr:iron-sulfur cluster repair di-iron protein [Sphingobacterium hotanense]MCT1525226.1 iron-sulfur cluster repair di-iron protein [Sphingobacterium hotanense]
MENLVNEKIGDIVAKNFHAAAVFSKYGLDFCCGGGKSVQEAAAKKSVDVEKLTEELKAVLSKPNETHIDYASWPADLLASYIEKTHHRYVREKAPVILAYLNKLCQVHGGRHPELLEVNKLFQECAKELGQHLVKEEKILFPYIVQMINSEIDHTQLAAAPFGSIENPIHMMEHEHDAEGERFEKIAKLTDNYAVPADGCSTYRVTYEMLKEFEDDLHKHIHLENNILFPKSIALQQALN